MTRWPAADQLGFESDPEDWFAEAPESWKRRVVNPPAAATGSRKWRAINKRYASEARVVLYQPSGASDPLRPTSSIRDTLIADADQESDHAYGRDGDDGSEGEVAEVLAPPKTKKKKKKTVEATAPASPALTPPAGTPAPIKPAFQF